MKTENNTKQNTSKEFIPDSTENIMAGARVFSEKASDIFKTFIEKVKETAESAYEKGSQIYESVSLSAQHYVERFKDRSEMAQLKEERDEVATQLGYMCFMEYSGRYRFRVEFMKGEEFKKLMSQLRQLDKEIIKLGEKLEAEV
ncbi:MAG: hypothetical protein ACWGNV_01205 [Bacteroidales bacterium]